LHWLTAILVLLAFLLSVGGPEVRVFADGNRAALALHESLGLAIFITTLVRLAHRQWFPPPPSPPMPEWMHRAAGGVRLMLYFLLVFTPLSAIAGSWLEGHALNVYLIGDVATPWVVDHALGLLVFSAHKLAGDGHHVGGGLALRCGAVPSLYSKRQCLAFDAHLGLAAMSGVVNA
jgi:cytochrome b561